ncbi:MAG TPA: hypothetical protein VGQ76_13630 [Thermoanaerobaculia bacterium]|nr:hypothetical protein [Thermoanaerobaculia bacterium]
MAGPQALDHSRYAKEPLDREALIQAYKAVHGTHDLSREVERLAHSDRVRALTIAVEILHRGASRGWDTFDVMSPLGDVLKQNGRAVLDELETQAKHSVAVRRALWRLRRQTMTMAWDQLEPLVGSTTDYTDLDVPVPPPQKQLDVDERIIEAWFEHEESFGHFQN